MSLRLLIVIMAIAVVASGTTTVLFIQVIRRFMKRSYPICWFCKNPIETDEERQFWHQMSGSGQAVIHAPKVRE